MQSTIISALTKEIDILIQIPRNKIISWVKDKVKIFSLIFPKYNLLLNVKELEHNYFFLK